MTIAIDFDGVIHAYSKGWQGGAIYDPPVPGAIDGLRDLMKRDAVFVFTARANLDDVAAWLTSHGIPAIVDEPGAARWFWDDRDRLLVTWHKLPATVYIDDRALRFESWPQTLAALDFERRLKEFQAEVRSAGTAADPQVVRQAFLEQFRAERKAAP
jgi:hypothetical protein